MCYNQLVYTPYTKEHSAAGIQAMQNIQSGGTFYVSAVY